MKYLTTILAILGLYLVVLGCSPKEIECTDGCELTVDLPNQIVKTPRGDIFTFDVDIFAKNCLLEGLDDIGWTLQFEDRIKDFENKIVRKKPWLFLSS